MEWKTFSTIFHRPVAWVGPAARLHLPSIAELLPTSLVVASVFQGGAGGGRGKVRAPIIKATFQGEVARPRSPSSLFPLCASERMHLASQQMPYF